MQFIERRLRLTVNPDKSAVAQPEKRNFVGSVFAATGRPTKSRCCRRSGPWIALRPRSRGSRLVPGGGRSTAVSRERTGTSEAGSASSGSVAARRKSSVFFTTRMLISDGVSAPFCFSSGSASATSHDTSFGWGHGRTPLGGVSTGTQVPLGTQSLRPGRLHAEQLLLRAAWTRVP